jgi:hypothetical protein
VVTRRVEPERGKSTVNGENRMLIEVVAKGSGFVLSTRVSQPSAADSWCAPFHTSATRDPTAFPSWCRSLKGIVSPAPCIPLVHFLIFKERGPIYHKGSLVPCPN